MDGKWTKEALDKDIAELEALLVQARALGSGDEDARWAGEMFRELIHRRKEMRRRMNDKE